MERKGRKLRVNMRGNDVKELQQALRQLGFAIAGEEGRFGKGTAQAVRAFQANHGADPTGEVDENAAKLIRGALAQRSDRSEDKKDQAAYSVSGYVRTTQDIPVPGITVQAFDIKVRKKTPLSKEGVKTNEDGYYQINCKDHLKKVVKVKQVDLVVECYGKDGQILDTSPLLINAPPSRTVNLTVPKTVQPAPTEFEELEVKIEGLIGECDLGSLDGNDFEYMATRSKLDVRKTRRFVHARILEQQASKIRARILKEQAGKYGEAFEVPTDVFYALLGDEEWPDLESLVSRHTSSLKQTIQEAINQEIIPSVSEKQINDFVAALKQVSVAIAVDPDVSSLRNQMGILDTIISEELRDDFIRDYTLNEQGDAKFWEELKKNEKFEEHFPAIQDLFTLAELTQKNLPLMRGLHETGGRVDEFAKWQVEDWEAYLCEKDLPLPEDAQASTPEQYARALAHNFKRRFPMVDLIDGLERSKVLTGTNRPSDDLKGFLRDHPDLDLGRIPVNRYLKRPHVKKWFEEKLEEKKQTQQQQDKLIEEIQGIQLAHALAPRRDHNACVAALRAFELEVSRYPTPQPVSGQGDKEEGGIVTEAEHDSALEITNKTVRDLIAWQVLREKKPQETTKPRTEPLATRKIKADSVLKIAGMNQADFVAAWRKLRERDGATDTDTLRGEGEEIYNRARYQAFAFAVNAWSIAAPLSSVTPDSHFVPNIYSQIKKRLSNHTSDTAPTIPDLTTLFGNRHYCECRHCQSIYGPAAYLVQLYHSLSDNARAKLYPERRPDILELHLDCENTNTKLPYIDLVIERLERLVGASLFQAFTRDHPWTNLQTTLSEQELALRPEHEFSDAYVLLSSLPYPMSMPWDKWFEEARLYLDYMGLPLYRLVEYFVPAFPDTRELDSAGAAFHVHEHRKKQINSEQCVRALLGLSVPLYDLISKSLDGELVPATLFFGRNSPFGLFDDNLNAVANLTDFMGKLDLWRENEKGRTGKEDFKLFRRILGSRYIQDSRDRSDLSIDIAFDQDHPCDPANARIENYDWNTIIRVTKFEHLRRALGWSPDELNQAIIVFSRNSQGIRGRLYATITSGIDIIISQLLQEVIALYPSLSDILHRGSDLYDQMTELVRDCLMEAIDESVFTQISDLVYLLDAVAIDRIPELVQLDVRGLVQDLMELVPAGRRIPDEATRAISEMLEDLIVEEIEQPLAKKIRSEEFIRLGTGVINEPLLAQISHLVRLQEKRAGFSVPELLSWWGPMDTNAGMKIISPSYEGEETEPEQISLYEKVFLDKSLYGKRDENPRDHGEWRYFDLNSRNTELLYLDNGSDPDSVSAHTAIVCAALQISEKELTELVTLYTAQAEEATLDLTLANLSTLYRAVSLVRYLDISIHEFVLLHEFVGHGMHPFKWMHESQLIKTETTLTFVECVEKIKRSPFEIQEIAYLWQHRTKSAETESEELEYVNRRIDEYLLHLDKGFKEAQQDDSIPISGNPISIDEIKNALEQIGLHEKNISRVEGLVRDGSADDSVDRAFIRKTFRFLASSQIDDLEDLLIDSRHSELPEDADLYRITAETLEQLRLEGVPDNVRQMLENLSDDYIGEKDFLDLVKGALEQTEMDEFQALILRHADKYLLRIVNHLFPIFRLSLFLSQELASFYGASQEVVRKLLSVVMDATGDGGALIQDFVDWDGSSPISTEIRNHLLRLDKIASIVNKWDLTAEEIEFIHWYEGDGANIFDWNSIPLNRITQPMYEEWSALAEYIQVRKRISLKEGDLIELFADAYDPAGKTEVVLKALGVLLNLEQGEIELIANELGYIEYAGNPPAAQLKNNALRNAESLRLVMDIAEAVKRSGRSVQVIRSWVGGDARGQNRDMKLEAGFVLEIGAQPYVELLEYKQGTVQDIRTSVKARCSDSQWQEVARRFQDQMRVLQRDRLLDWAIAWFVRMEWSALDHKWVFVYPPFRNPEDVYDHLLIDPLVNPCMNTTRLKSAISSLQLFIHRILMGLEGEELKKEEEETTALAEEWKWKKNYRVWEAQQKVFIYPENWIEPELRDNKTPFFEEFEDELAQSEIDERSIGKAYLNYLVKVDEVSHLEVASFKEELLLDGEQEIGRELHVIGRTREKPRIYYYRKRNSNQIWLPWQRLDLDIDSEVVLLTVYNGLPYLFWPTVKERIEKLGIEVNNPEADDPEKDQESNYRPCFEIRFNWSCRTDGRWSSRKRTDESLVWLYDWEYRRLFKNPEELLRYKIEPGPNPDALSIAVNVLVDVQEAESIQEEYLWKQTRVDAFFNELWRLIDTGIVWNVGGGSGHVFTDQDLKDLKTTFENKITICRIDVNCALDEHRLEDAIEDVRELVQAVHDRLFTGSTAICTYANTEAGVTNDGRQVSGLKHEDIESLYGLFLENRLAGFAAYMWLPSPSGDVYQPVLFYLESDTAIRNEFFMYGIPVEEQEQAFKFTKIKRSELCTSYKLLQIAKLKLEGYKLRAAALNSLGNLVNINYSPVQVRFSPSEKYSLYDYYTMDPDGEYNWEVRWRFCNNALQVHYDTWRFDITRPDQPSDTLFYPDSNPGTVVPRDTDEFDILFYQDARHCYLIEHMNELYECTEFYNPSIKSMIQSFFTNVGRADDRLYSAALGIDVQSEARILPYKFTGKCPVRGSENNTQKRPTFDLVEPFGLYNWEIFFHMPFTIAVRLSQQQKFAEAQQWFHYIFNPLASLSLGDGEEYDEASRYWEFLPLHQLEYIDSIRAWKEYLEGNEECAFIVARIEAEMAHLARDPFQPHRIARWRLQAYQKAVVMKYLDNLVEWGDTLFAQDTIESLNEATQLYVLAAKILGPRPRLVPRPKTLHSDDSSTIQDVVSYSEEMVGAERETMLVTKERILSDYHTPPGEVGLISTMQWFRGFPPEADDAEEPPFTLDERPVFCVPHNDKLLSYWDTVAERLFKVRNCMNIEGVVRELPPFEPPIDPGLLVRGQTLGIDISELLSDLYAPLPPYRFRVMLQKAYEFCGDVQKLGGALLSALEKKDAEELSLMRSKHERQLLKLTESIKKQQIKELRENLKSLQVSLEMAESRFEYYSSRRFENQNEKAQVSKLGVANAFQIASQVVSVTAAAAYGFPEITQKQPGPGVDIRFGGANVGHAAEAMGRFLNIISAVYSHEANMHSIQGGRERRMDDWKFQARQASREIKQIEKQLLAAEIRLDIAEKELNNHEKQQEQAEKIETFMKSKFTNQELYHWMVSQISSVYFQTYRMAVGLAKTAQQCYRQELGDDAASFVGAAYWDNLKKGLLAGEKLQFDLRRMENAYLEQNKREYELTKHVSLAMLDPVALVTLKATGECYVNLPEAIFDLDYPGHYMRRIKAVSLSIPCVTGPYTSVNCTLTLQSNRIRRNTDTRTGYFWDGTYGDDRFLYDTGGIQSISTSSAREDSGLFELNFHDERYLPFEGAGAISTWHIELSKQFRQFDYDTISDVVMHVRYTARRDGGVQFKGAVEGGLTEVLKKMVWEAGQAGLSRLFSARQEFPNEWHRFLNDDPDYELAFEVSAKHFPFLTRDKSIKIQKVGLYVQPNPKVELAAAPAFELPDATFESDAYEEVGDLLYQEEEVDWELSATAPQMTWTLKMLDPPEELKVEEEGRLDPEKLENVALVCYYTLE